MLNKKALSGTAAAAGWDIENATWDGTTTWYDFGDTGDDRGIFPGGIVF